MGTITTTHTEIGQWLDRIDTTRNHLIESARSGNRVAAAFAMADARCDLIDSLKDEAIRAKLLRMTDPEICMVELANSPTPDDRIRVCAIAILSGFTPGNDEFAVFGGGKNPGKLYTKERGFRTLFSHLGIVPEVQTTHPEFVPFGKSGKKIWRVGGTASATYQGVEYVVEFADDQLIGINGYETDNVAGISAKARRRILQALWVKVSPILTTDHMDDDDPDSVPVSQSKVIEAKPETPQEEPQQTPEPTREEIFLVTWRGEMSGLRDKQASDIAASLKSAWEANDREAVEKIALEQIPEVTHTRNRDKLERFANAIGDYLTYQKEVQG